MGTCTLWVESIVVTTVKVAIFHNRDGISIMYCGAVNGEDVGVAVPCMNHPLEDRFSGRRGITMKEYYLGLMGLRIVLRTPHNITISENLQPFLCEKHDAVDCEIDLKACCRLPDFCETGVWHGLEYYDCCQGTLRVFHCNAPETAAFAVTQLFQNGNVEISVLPDHLSWFSGTEGIFNRIGMETLLLQHKGLLLHASLIKYAGKAIAFAGPSGVGKSTHANLWKEHMDALIINGDRAALRNTENGWMAFGSPYAGTSGIYVNDNGPLAAIVLLQQAGENRLREISATETFQHIYPELSVHQWDKNFVADATDLCLRMLTEIPVYMLQCRPDADAALLVKKGLGL